MITKSIFLKETSSKMHLVRNHILGLTLVGVIVLLALYLAKLPFFANHHLSALLIGVILGLICSLMTPKIAPYTDQGIQFSVKKLLRLGIILYGFKVSIAEMMHFGITPVLVASLVVLAILGLGIFFGKKLGIDQEISLLVAIGSAICGAAAVLALESVLKSQAFKSIIAVGTVVVFGMIAMFFYPFVYHLGIIPLTPMQEGVYIGATLHEVANVVGASSSISLEAEKIAITVKMIRVLFLIPVLLFLSFYLSKTQANSQNKTRLHIPWFAFVFLGMVILHSYLGLLTQNFLDPQILEKGFSFLRQLSEICLIFAMSALGLQVDLKKIILNGGKAFLLAFILFIFLLIGGLFLVKWLI